MNREGMALRAGYLLRVLLTGSVLHKPYHCQFQATRRCGFRCAYCRVWREGPGERGELSLDEIAVLSRNLRAAGVKSVVITGGEPLLREDLVEIMKIFKRDRLLVRLQTNGHLLTTAFLERAFLSGLDDISISLDTLRQDVFRGISGMGDGDVLERVLDNIRDAASCAKKHRAGVFLMTVVQPANSGEVEDLLSFAKQNRCIIGFYGLEPGSGRDVNDIRSYDPRIAPDEDQRGRMKRAFERLRRLKREGRAPIFNSARHLDDYVRFYGDGRQNMQWDCRAGRYYLTVLPDGRVCACNATPGMTGFDYRNIHELYERPDREAVFREYRGRCSGCLCTRQLEYLIGDFSDVIEKTRLYARTTLGK